MRQKANQLCFLKTSAKSMSNCCPLYLYLPTDCGVIIVTEELENVNNYKKRFEVNLERVNNALIYLQKHNHLYKDVDISKAFQDEVKKQEKDNKYESIYDTKNAAHIVKTSKDQENYSDEEAEEPTEWKVIHRKNGVRTEVLVGLHHQLDNQDFSKGGASKHAFEIAIISIGFIKIKSIAEWGQTDLESILYYGNSMYRKFQKSHTDRRLDPVIVYDSF